MAFGQPSGPQAPARQVAELLELLHDAGHAGFRDARGPMGFTQRQAAGKFTRDEVDSFIARLQAEADGEGPAATTAATTRSFARPATRSSADEVAARRLPDQLLAAELRRRGWTVAEP
jgi:hypothetical protein